MITAGFPFFGRLEEALHFGSRVVPVIEGGSFSEIVVVRFWIGHASWCQLFSLIVGFVRKGPSPAVESAFVRGTVFSRLSLRGTFVLCWKPIIRTIVNSDHLKGRFLLIMVEVSAGCASFRMVPMDRCNRSGLLLSFFSLHLPTVTQENMRRKEKTVILMMYLFHQKSTHKTTPPRSKEHVCRYRSRGSALT